MTPKNLHWWQSGVVYQIYPRSFKDSNGDGIGDLQGVIDKLDYLNDGTPNSLGVDAIWLSPFYPSPMVDFGYDVADYCAVDPIFGDLATFDRLVVEAHRRGMKVIIDWVPNHTSDQHPWFQESRSSRDNPKRDWYIWRDGRGAGLPPNNWRDGRGAGLPPNNWGSVFGGPAWTLDEKTGQYYLHQFVPEQPELNWRNPPTEQAMLDVLRFWLLRGVDGMRMDVIHFIIKDEALRDNPSNQQTDLHLPANDLFGRLVQKYNLDQDDVHTYIRHIRNTLDEFDERCAIGEIDVPLQRWVNYFGTAGEELHMPFNFRLIFQPWQAAAMRASVDEMEAALPSFAWPNYVLGNHDQGRLASRYGGEAQARLAAMLLLTLRGTPTLYYADEIGLPNAVIPPERVMDPQGKNLGVERSRDVERTPMQWDASPNAGFSTSEPWLPVQNDFSARNVATQTADPNSILNLYRRLSWLRHSSPALQAGSYHSMDSADDCFIYLREEQGERKLVALNFIDRPAQVRLSLQGQGQVLLSTNMDFEDSIDLSAFSLRPFEGLLVDLPG
ncbi:MAG TPA: alpha-amylase family glycosyl hydrolase [Anaerolineales bacterium]|jgi:alpha-glucosidase